MNTYQIPASQLKLFFEQLIDSGKVIWAPVVKKSGKAFFQQVNSYSEIAENYLQTVFSAKDVVFPKVEELFSYRNSEDGFELQSSIPQIPETVVWGIRPCDAAGFNYLTEFFMRENPDPYFAARKSHTTLISSSCSQCDESCFCTSVGLSPGNTLGSDLQFTSMNGVIYTEVVTNNGQNIVDSSSLFTPCPAKSKEQWLATPTIVFSVNEIQTRIKNTYEQVQWKHESLGCYGCGACAFACPTCSCFDIQDEGTTYQGKRIRCWDACGFALFTKQASGHNPKQTQMERRRQRILHKFKYSVDNLGMISCVGCGRCIRVCPAHLNIFENILKVTE